MSRPNVPTPTSSSLNDDRIRRTLSHLLPKLSAWNSPPLRRPVTESTQAIERAQLRVGRGKPHLPVLFGALLESRGYGHRRDHQSSVRLRLAMTSLSAQRSVTTSRFGKYSFPISTIQLRTRAHAWIPSWSRFSDSTSSSQRCVLASEATRIFCALNTSTRAARISSEVGARCDIGR